MDRALSRALTVIFTSLGLAVLFNFLFFDKLIGISMLIFTAVLLGAVFVLGSSEQTRFQKRWWLCASILFFALMLSIRANEFLSFLNLCAIFGLLMIVAYDRTDTPVFLMKLRDYFMLIFLVPFRMLRQGGRAVSAIGQIQSPVKSRDTGVRVLKGTLMALPLLIIFGLLFAQADLAFSKFVNGFFTIKISEYAAGYTASLLFAFVEALSFLSYIFFSPKKIKKVIPQQSEAILPSAGRALEVSVFLGLIATLFLIFIGFQITYLFGGETNIVNAGFTYAEYARRGFWELLAVTILSLAVLVVSEKYSGSEVKRDKKFLTPALILIAEVVVIIISAFKRLSLYIDAYGLTTLRFYVAGFIILLLILFILLAIKFFTSKKEEFFAFGTLLSLTAFLIAVNALNPDVFIIKFNLEQYRQTGKIDVSYLRELSVDAVPWKIDLYQNVAGEDKEILGALLQKEKDILERHYTTWQSANLSRTRALKLLHDFNPS